MKWVKDERLGTIVAGSLDKGNVLGQLCHPQGIFLDTLGTLYVADSGNNRVMRWRRDEKYGTMIVGKAGQGKTAQKLNRLR
ncbi:unnamed protein product, partial [Rotaria magnacalcarata]